MPASQHFNWLHLTDLHFGQAGQSPLWPNAREAFFKDLRALHDRCGPWQAVLFTGDLVYSGQKEQFEQMEAEVLVRLWKELAALGSGEAVLLAVPGNHDLVRPDPKKPLAAERQLLRPGGLAEIEEEFWGDSDSEYRQVVARAFDPYATWWRRTQLRGKIVVNDGLLPGDFAATLVAGSRQIGVIGLNTTFLQLAGGDFERRLAWDVRQVHAVCVDPIDWHTEHDACLLLTHQGPEWLDERSRQNAYPEIYPAGRFAVHLFGHMHETEIFSTNQGGGESVRQWQGRSMFGMERFGATPREMRRHGYGAGRITFGARETTVRYWPRRAFQDANNWRFVPHHEKAILEQDDGTPPERVSSVKRASRKRAHGAVATSKAVISPDALIGAYVKAARTLWDIIDLAGLPEGERHLAMHRFVLRQLYVPLRLVLEHRIDERDFSIGEKQRARLRLLEAARHGTIISQEERKSLGAWSFLRSQKEERESLGEWLRSVLEITPRRAPRLVLLGDPGGGKTTLLRWLATAYLLRREGSPDLEHLPDAGSLPAANWLPIMIRCRELDREQVGQCTLEDLLNQSLTRMELPRMQAESLVPVLRRLLDSGRALLLIDGLDEITDPVLRAAFCQRLETVAKAFSHAPVLVTSRIVGYREMHRRISQGFAHATLAELTPREKDDFVQRWCAVTLQDPTRRETETEKLQRGIHGSDRVERLTTNPMMLTTMALVQRQVGQLPGRRHKLYWEAVKVLLNWRSEVETPMDPEEVLPQLEYLAYAMCDRGVQRLRRDEVLALLEGVRHDLPNIRPVQRQTPEVFLAGLERRTGLLVQVGETVHDGRPVAVYEFRHLTFQEYLAALALVEGRFPGHQAGTKLAERVRPLAGRLANVANRWGRSEVLVTENWREALRLCVASCNDDDVDMVLQAILQPEHSEEGRPRAILALLCLADEPNVSKAKADMIIRRFVEHVNDADSERSDKTGAFLAAVETKASVWGEALEATLIQEFIQVGSDDKEALGSLAGAITFTTRPEGDIRQWVEEQIRSLNSSSELEIVSAAMTLAATFKASMYSISFSQSQEAGSALLTLFFSSPIAAHAATKALSLLQKEGRWKPTPTQLDMLLTYLEEPNTDFYVLCFLVNLMGHTIFQKSAPTIATFLRSSHADLRTSAATTLGLLGDRSAINDLLGIIINDQHPPARKAAAVSLGQLGSKPAVLGLLDALCDQDSVVRSTAANALGKLGSRSAVPGLLDALRDQDSGVRSNAVNALGQLRSASAIFGLLDALRDQDSVVRSDAADALGQVGHRSAIPALLEALSDMEPVVRSNAVKALGQLRGRSAVPGLLGALCDQDPVVRSNAAKALGRLGSKSAVLGLLDALHDQNSGVCCGAAAAVLAIGGNSTIPSILEALLCHQDETVRYFALVMLRDKAVMPGLLRALRHREAFVRMAVVNALAKFFIPAAQIYLQEALSDEDLDVRCESLAGLVRAEQDEVSITLLTTNLDARFPWLDPLQPISLKHAEAASGKLSLSSEEVRTRYETLAEAYDLKLAWREA